MPIVWYARGYALQAGNFFWTPKNTSMCMPLSLLATLLFLSLQVVSVKSTATTAAAPPTEIPFCQLLSPQVCMGTRRVFVERVGNSNPFNTVPSTTYAMIVHYDFDSDGDYDLLESGINRLFYLENIGTATSPNYVKSTLFDYTSDGGGHGWVTPALFDLDDDGDMDFILFGPRKTGSHEKALGLKGVKYYENIGNTSYPKFQVWNTPLEGDLVEKDVQFAWSFPLFGKINLIGESISGQRFNFYENIGGTPHQFAIVDGSQNPLHSFQTSDYATFTYGDIDNDGDVDILSNNGTSSTHLLKMYLLLLEYFLRQKKQNIILIHF